jgi:hypothetical protein
MCSFRNRPEEVDKHKIKSLWRAIIEVVDLKIEKHEYRLIASDLARWLSLVDTIDDDIHEMLQVSLEAIEENWNSSFFVESLRKHVRETPPMVGKLFLKMLRAEIYPSYKKEDIVFIVETLYELGEGEAANRIANIYFSKGFDFLREVFERYN